jgi:hypothetical protein
MRISSSDQPEGKQPNSLALRSVADHRRIKIPIFSCLACIQVHGVERHNLFMSLVPGVEHPQSVEPPPLNVQRCYMHVEDDDESGARAVAGKSQHYRKKVTLGMLL